MRFNQGLHRTVRLRGGSTSTVYGGRRRTWKETYERVARLASGLLSYGLTQGDRVYIIALNSDHYLELYHAIAWAGAVAVPGNYRWTAFEHREALQDSGASFLIIDETHIELIASLGVRQTVRTLLLGEVINGAAGHSTEELLAGSTPVEDRCGDGDELAAIFYTGGTTGRAKGVMLSHANLVVNFLQANATAPFPAEPIFLHSAPMFHLADASAMLGVTIGGGTHVITARCDPAAAVELIRREQVSAVVMVPTIFAQLREHLSGVHDALSSVRLVRYGAASISESLLREAMNMFPNAEFQQAYGQTELSPVATILEARHHLPDDAGRSFLRSAGRPIYGVDLRIVDERRAEVPRGVAGEIMVRGPGVMMGYWKKPDLTAETVIDGWLRTGDAAYMDEDGFVYLVDRIKNMIISGGENVYSAEVENALASHPAVVECAVIGVPDEKWGERVHAIVRLRAGISASKDDLFRHVRTRLAGYKCPRSIDVWHEPLPLSSVGKMDKPRLRELFG